jgi:hypothetical protein
MSDGTDFIWMKTVHIPIRLFAFSPKFGIRQEIRLSLSTFSRFLPVCDGMYLWELVLFR